LPEPIPNWVLEPAGGQAVGHGHTEDGGCDGHEQGDETILLGAAIASIAMRNSNLVDLPRWRSEYGTPSHHD
jgi:hypothetical protein